MTVVTLVDFTPIPRTDDNPWTLARIQEAAAADGPWTTIETITLDPVDSDPSAPATRTLTTEEATLEEGWYRVVFVDGTGDEQSPTEPVQRSILDAIYLPVVSDVATLLRSRTKDEFGNEKANFDSSTTPTHQQVDRFIAEAHGDFTTRFRSDIPEALWPRARALVAIKAAMLVELSYFPEQVRSDRSAYEHLKTLYDEGLATLVEAVAESGVGGGGESIGGEGTDPVFSFGTGGTTMDELY